MSNSELVRSSVDFLKIDGNKNEYFMHKPRGSKNIYNFNKRNICEISHSPTIDKFINPINTYSQFPFNGSSNFYIDFQLPKFEYLFHQFILRFKLTNTSNLISKVMPTPLIFEKVCILKNSNSLGNDIFDWDIFLFNLNKFANEFNNNGQRTIACAKDGNGYLSSYDYAGNAAYPVNIELPISLNRSEFPACCIKNDLVLRVYFKNNIVYDGCNNSQIQLSDVVLALRVKEISCYNRVDLFKQPKLNFIFHKRIIQKYNIPSITAGLNYSVNLSGFKNCASCALAYIMDPENNISYSSLSKLYHTMKYKMTEIYLTDATGQNLVNNNKLDDDYNQYLILNKFKQLNNDINDLTFSLNNQGEIIYVGFCSESTDPFLNGYEGGLLFDGNYKFNFKSLSTSTNNVVLNIMFFVPALLDLYNGDLNEYLS